MELFHGVWTASSEAYLPLKERELDFLADVISFHLHNGGPGCGMARHGLLLLGMSGGLGFQVRAASQVGGDAPVRPVLPAALHPTSLWRCCWSGLHVHAG